MKYSAGLLGIMLLCTQAWAAPEQMKMFATLSAPIASFGKIKTELKDRPVVPKKEFNIGSEASTGGSITLKSKKALAIKNLWMEDTTKLNIGASKWRVGKIVVAPQGKLDIQGYLLANQLINNTEGTPWNQITATNLRVGNNPLSVNTVIIRQNIVTEDGVTLIMNDGGSSGDSSGTTWKRIGCSVQEKPCGSQSSLYLLTK